MTDKPATEGLAAGLAEFVLVPREPTPEWIKDMDVHLLSKYGAELGPAVAREMIANVLAAAPSPASSGETQLNGARSLIDAFCKRALDTYPPATLRDKLATDLFALATPPQKPGIEARALELALDAFLTLCSIPFVPDRPTPKQALKAAIETYLSAIEVTP